MSTPSAAAHLPPGQEAVFHIDGFEFDSGERLDRLTVGYVTFGHLNSRRDNLLLLMPGTGNLRHSALGHVGPGRSYDTDRYCVVCTDAIGGGTSSKPSDGARGRFPRYTIRDMVRAQHRLVSEGLGLGDTPAAVVAGASMGAFQTLEWLIAYPQGAQAAVLLVPGWRASHTFRLATERMLEMITLDVQWQGGNDASQPLDGLRSAGRHYFPWTVSDAYLESIPYRQAVAEAAASGEWFAQWDAWDLMRRYQASAGHDVSEPFAGRLHEALTRIDARVLLMPCAQDRLLGLEGARQIAAGIRGARLRVIESPKGHLAWRAVPGSAQTVYVTREVRDFLDEVEPA
jgi:homoserine O-acetyltransferase